ncbi:MAG TPA: polysaccharide deacetylase family protein [Bacteroidales bacterium]|nr:polysaccharide deacetylase family protein [Bacteroidales bacterium]
MITVVAYNNFLEERKYILDFIFGEVFDCDYKLSFDQEKSYRISNENKTLIVADSFFAEMEEGFPYYGDKSLIPDKVDFIDYPEQNVYRIPVLFGKSDLKSNDGTYFLANDLFAGIFFMLTRWEEIALAKFDKHERFVEAENLSVKFDYYDRPVVNEYIQLIRSLLKNLGININYKNRDFNIFLTHDIDEIARYDTFGKIVKALGGDIVKRKSIKTFIKTLKDVYHIKIKNQNDVYDTFDFLMNTSEKKGLQSRFYFIPGYSGEKDVRFDIRNRFLKTITDRIKYRGHIIGIHPSYSSFCNINQLREEKKRLENYVENIYEGRQHYLRLKIPNSWQDWEDSNLKIDSSVGFYDRTGFRAGICFEYPLFNVVTRKKLQLRERPLIVMDTALRKQCVTKEKTKERGLKLFDCTKKFDGDFVLLWHNSNLSVNEWEGWDEVYKSITEKI